MKQRLTETPQHRTNPTPLHASRWPNVVKSSGSEPYFRGQLFSSTQGQCSSASIPWSITSFSSCWLPTDVDNTNVGPGAASESVFEIADSSCPNTKSNWLLSATKITKTENKVPQNVRERITVILHSHSRQFSIQVPCQLSSKYWLETESTILHEDKILHF